MLPYLLLDLGLQRPRALPATHAESQNERRPGSDGEAVHTRPEDPAEGGRQNAPQWCSGLGWMRPQCLEAGSVHTASGCRQLPAQPALGQLPQGLAPRRDQARAGQ